jgi:hypothetical protein
MSPVDLTFGFFLRGSMFLGPAGVEIQPEKPYLHTDEDGMTKLHLSQVFYIFLD